MKITAKNIFILVSLVAAVVGGLVIEVHPVLGGTLLLVGLIGSIYLFVAGEKGQKYNEAFFDSTAQLLFASGVGNPYTKMVSSMFAKPGKYKNVIDDLEKALAINPNDADALAMYVSVGVLHLARNRVAGVSKPPTHFTDPQKLDQMISRGIKTGSRVYEFYCAKGFLLDHFGRGQEARRWFEQASHFGGGPSWRIYACTSYGMEKDFDSALKEIQTAISEGARGWIVDFYLGRSMLSVGEYEEALSSFRRARRVRGLTYEQAIFIKDAYYLSWHPVKSAYYELLAALYVFRINWRKALEHARVAIKNLYIPTLVSFTRAVSRISSRLPILHRSRLARLCPADEPYASLGVALAKKGQYLAAKKQFTVATQRSQRVETWLNLCTASILSQDWEEAERACLLVLEMSPENPLAISYLDPIRRRELPTGACVDFSESV